jgi:hypothetical protein
MKAAAKRRPRLGLLIAMLALSALVVGVAEAAKGKKVKASIETATDVIDNGNQGNNNGNPIQGDEIGTSCTGNKRAVGAGGKWSFENPSAPDETAAQIQILELGKKSLTARGATDVGGSGTSTFTAQLVCLKAKDLKIKLRSASDSVDVGQVTGNGSTNPVGPVEVACGKKSRVLGAGWSWDFVNSDTPPDEPAQAESIDIGKKKVIGVGQSDVNADVQEFTVQAVCIKKPGDAGLKVKIRTASDTFDSTGQANNDGGVVISDPVQAKCKKKERAVGAGTDWSYSNPEDPQNTAAEIESLDIGKKSVTGIGGSDTNATSTFTVQAVCVSKKS